MSSCLTVCANIGLFHFSFSITPLVPLLFTSPPPLIPIYHQPSRIKNVFITCDLDELCEWVRNKRSFFIDKDFTVDGLLEYEEQCSSSMQYIISGFRDYQRREHNDHIKYQPVCSDWQKERCALLGLTFIRVNHPHLTQPSMIAVSHCPLATARIAADGNCFFQSVSLAVTGSQEFHEELRLLITTYMIHKPNRSSVILPWIP